MTTRNEPPSDPLADLAAEVFGSSARVSKLCAACPARLTRAELLRRRDAQAERRLRPPTTRGQVVATVELDRGLVITAEVVIRDVRTDVRLQVNARKEDGELRVLPLRVTFASSRLAAVLSALASVQRVLSSAVPIAPDPAPLNVRQGLTQPGAKP